MTGQTGAVQGINGRLRRFARALTGNWTAADTLCRYATEALKGKSGGAGGATTPLDLFQAASEIWNGPVGETIEKSSAREIKLRGSEQRRVAAMPRRVREIFLLTTIGGLSYRDAAKATKVSEADLNVLLKYARSTGGSEEAGRVLIIEDEALIARDLEKIVTDLGHIVIGKARTRVEAVAMLGQQKPTLVLADMQLFDESSGVDAVNDIIAQAGEMPVIFITAFPAKLFSSQRPAPTFLVNKPYETSDVRAAITEVLYFGIKSSRSIEAGAEDDGPPLVHFD